MTMAGGAPWPGAEAHPVAVQLLGPVRVWRDGAEVELGPARQRAVLAALAAAGRVVSVSELVDGVWGPDAPPSAVQNLHTYVAGLRRVLEPARIRRSPGQLLVSVGSGYALRLAAEQVDAALLADRFRRARELAAGTPAEAVGVLDAALALGSGPPLDGMSGPFADAERARLVELRSAAAQLRFELLLRLGRHAEAVGELSAAVGREPLRERLRELLMLALYRAGRRAEALAQFTEARRFLVAELGIEPGPELRRLHSRILTTDPALTGPAREVPTPVGTGPDEKPPGTAVPELLPHGVTGFVGRRAELARLGELVPAAVAAAPVVISAVEGAAGVGKTALAVRFAHQVAGRFPDGQLYLDLRGFDPRQPPLPAGEALGALLLGLGLAAAALPAGAAARSALFRGAVAGKRMLVLLDNARSSEQVRPLLPGAGGCLVLITSRNSLGGLVARDGAYRLTLDVLPPDEAHELIGRVAGEHRAAAEPAAVAALARLCGYLPLALRIAAERAAANPHTTLAALVTALDAERDRLDLLATADGDQTTAVRAVFSWSYQALPAAAARLFRLLGLHPGPAFSDLAAAAIAGLTPAATRPLLDTLTAAHLLQPAAPGRHRFHDLLRVYAADRAAADEPAPDRAAATTRILTWYLHTAAAAARVLHPGRRLVEVGPLDPAVPSIPAVADQQRALSWYQAEYVNLVAAVHHAAKVGEDTAAWKLAVILASYMDLRKHWTDWIETHETALSAARRLGHRGGESTLLNGLGVAYVQLERYPEALAVYQQAAAVRREEGDRWGESTVLGNIGDVYYWLGRYDEACAHFELALRGCRETGNREAEAGALSNLGEAYREMGRYADALEHSAAALAIFEAIGDAFGEGIAQASLGQTCQRMGRSVDALHHFERALTAGRRIGDRFGEAECLESIGAVLHEMGETASARRSRQQALAIVDQLSGPRADDIRARLAEDEVVAARPAG